MSFAPPAPRSRLPSCPRCHTPLPPGSKNCAQCSSDSLPLLKLPSTALRTPTPAQVAFQRLISLVADFALGVATLGVGWLVWAGLLVSRGQSPAGRMFHLSFVDDGTGRQPSNTKLIVRLCVLFVFGLYLVAGALWGYGLLIDVGGYWVHSRVIPSVVLLLIFSDLVALGCKGRRRLLDRVLRIEVSPTRAANRRLSR